MKNLYLLAVVLSIGTWQLHAQSPVPVGAGSYASFPPVSELDSSLQAFVYTAPIYVAQNKKHQAIPTNDWWTDLVVSQYAGMLWAYPLSADPENFGTKIYFANSFVADGSNLEYGGYMSIKADGYAPEKAIAKDWSDWGVVMSLPDSTHGKNMDVTMYHGIPFFWFETQGINPEIALDKGGSYLTASGNALTLPTNKSFVIKTDGRYFGIHLDGKTTAAIQGQQFVRIDLGSSQHVNAVKLSWETAYASGYSIQVSNDTTSWATVVTVINGDGGTDSLSFKDTTARYVKITLNERGTIYAYSLWEMQVFNNTTLLSQNKSVTASSVEGPFAAANVNDGNFGTRWASDGNQSEKLVLNTNSGNAFFVVSALLAPADLTTYEQYAFNKPTNSTVSYDYNAGAGKVAVNWNVTTTNLKGGSAGPTIQGFLPHLYDDATHNVNFSAYSYVSPRGTMKTSIGNAWTFTYDFGGILPNFNAPYRSAGDAAPYDAGAMYNLLTQFSKKKDYGGDTYWGGKDILNFAKYTVMAKELNHQAYESLKAKTRAALVNWLTYTPGETEKFFAKYDRWGAIVGFNESYTSAYFTDNHFHYGYFVLAAALYGMVDPDFIAQYGDMIKLVAKQYANWDRSDTTLPFLRTFDPWIGHSYAGGTSSSTGNNQESSSEAIQSWIGLFLLGDQLNDPAIRSAAAFGYSSETYAALEYWFDWKNRNLPATYNHNMCSILSNQGFAYGTYFSASPMHIHAIQYLPVNPGFKYVARDTTWAKKEYADMMSETLTVDGHKDETDFGDDWAHVALGWKQISDPRYAAAFMAKNLLLPVTDTDYIMDYEVAGMTYYYTHAHQNLGDFSFKYHTNFPSSSVFEKNGSFSHAVAYNPSASTSTCKVYDASGAQVASFSVPARTLLTYPVLPDSGSAPTGCYNLVPASATASSGTADAAIDGNQGSRWESQFTDPQWITVDMGVVSHVNKITLTWEVANAKEYYILGAKTDTLSWDTVGHYINTTTGNRTDLIDNIGKDYRYLRMYGVQRNTPYGYSIYEFEICGTASEPTTADAARTTSTAKSTNTSLVYPNPAQDQVYLTAAASAYYTITDLKGNMIQAGKVTAGMNTISVSGLTPGVYLIRVGDKTGKFVKL
ncbi:glycosyl hydrolase [Chitinophaga silvisoli]|nr:glycosyl hydrolase [Chitinophaga silvisoli]